MLRQDGKDILVITTGGTIGALPMKNPQEVPKWSYMPPDGRDIVREVICTNFVALKTRCISLETRDSQLIDEQYRNRIAEIVEAAPENSVLITHGTDSLLQTADFLYRRFKENMAGVKKLVVLTGAMVPLANGEKSDGYLNLAFSLGLLTKKNADMSGVYFVLCDYDNPETESGEWRPRLYAYLPETFDKIVNVSDNRYSRIRRIQL